MFVSTSRVVEAGNELFTDMALIDGSERPTEFSATPMADARIQDSGGKGKFRNKTNVGQEMWNKVILEIMSSMPKMCSKCSQPSNTIKKDGYLRLLQKPLSKRVRGQLSKATPKALAKEAKNKSDKSKKSPQEKSKKKKKSEAFLSSDEEDGEEDDDDSELEDDEAEDDDEDEDEEIMAGKVVEREVRVCVCVCVHLCVHNHESHESDLFTSQRNLERA
jgi:hypothetical protein